MDKDFQAMGHDVSIHRTPSKQQYKVDVKNALKTLEEYAEAKQNLDQRIISNERWYKLRHWEYLRAKSAKDDETKNSVEPASAWLFNSLANKHADAMDNFPEPNVLPREQGDEQDAKLLTSIVPVVLERNDFEETNSRAWWYKLKQGCVPYGVFWDSRKLNGLGDITIKKLDLLNLFWEPGVTDIQDSRNFFIISTIDPEVLKAQYPDKITGNETTSLRVTEYLHDESLKLFTKSVVVDWYFKMLLPNGKTVLHYCKFVGDTVLFSSLDEVDQETGEEAYPNGWYEHGMYPVVFDVLFPEEDMPTGIGYIDIMKDPQLYIDKLDQIIMTNALRAGKSRWFINRSGNVSEDEFADWDKDFVHINGLPDEKNLREIKVNPLDAFIVTHKQMKIDELKETSGNRDFSQGGTASGVTAAAAISALQEAGNKLSRDMIKGGYRSYRSMVYMVIELIRQFYDTGRQFRIVGDKGMVDYITYSNANIRSQLMPAAYAGEGPAYRVPIFDIVVKAQKENPFNKAAQNDLAVTLYQLGFFNPANSDASLAALELMNFEGKQKVEQRIADNGTMFQQLQQLLQILTGGVPPTGGGGGDQKGAPVKKSMDAATQDRAVDNATTSYAQKTAERARPDIDRKAGVNV